MVSREMSPARRGHARPPLPAALDCRGIGRLLRRDRQHRTASDKAHGSMGKAADDVWKHFGEHHADAEPEQQGNDAEKHSGENAGRGPHGL